MLKLHHVPPNPPGQPQATALRQQLRQLMENAEAYDLQNTDDVQPQVDLLKRSLSSIARGGVRYGSGSLKRNIGALARQGMLRSNEPDDGAALGGAQKRSLATLAKNGQLPSATSQEPDREDGVDETGVASPLMQLWKRNMAALARAGLLGPGRGGAGNFEEGKRNVGALARDWTLPTQSNNRLNRK